MAEVMQGTPGAESDDSSISSSTAAPADGSGITSNRRLFMQLVAYGGCGDTTTLVDALESNGIAGALYEDVNDPHGVALLTFSEDPAYFVDDVRPFLRRRRSPNSCRNRSTRCSDARTRWATSPTSTTR